MPGSDSSECKRTTGRGPVLMRFRGNNSTGSLENRPEPAVNAPSSSSRDGRRVHRRSHALKWDLDDRVSRKSGFQLPFAPH